MPSFFRLAFSRNLQSSHPYSLHAVLYWVALAGLLLCLGLPSQAQAADDGWWAKDKRKHLIVSSSLAGVTYLWLGQTRLEPAFRMGASALVVLGLGALKEAWDALGYGQPSWKDMTWNVIGSAVGLVVAWFIEHWLWPAAPRGIPGRVSF
ncbi:MAG: hypothetical protein FWD46_01420 [Cystobacterineae bacterium]|nr:hypothetical protein [Cystobacterineae bacterium]